VWGHAVVVLALYPLGILYDLSDGIAAKVPMGASSQLFVASGVYVACGAMLWWYWFCLLPWMAIGGLVLSLGVGWCFGFIELAGIQ